MNSINPLAHPAADLFLLGFIVASSFVATVFFLRFWRSTRDPLFLSFAAFFAVQCISHAVVVGFSHPNEGNFWLFMVRLLAIIGILVAILWKNLKRA